MNERGLVVVRTTSCSRCGCEVGGGVTCNVYIIIIINIIIIIIIIIIINIIIKYFLIKYEFILNKFCYIIQ